MPNRLARETSPYLQQHADNPVDWHPWGEEALERARAEDKPILLSIGYSACHWCHVMAHESFEDPAVAAVMNRLFVNIKVDREERPDLDQIYQLAHQMISQRAGGWPLTVFLTPAQVPFYAGTYFPNQPRHGLPGFADLCERIVEVWKKQRTDIERQNAALMEALAREAQPPAGSQSLTAAPIEGALRSLTASFDARNGGFGNAPKFPHPAELELFLTRHAATGDAHALHVVVHTLERMALGGINDQLGGGFARYSVDGEWRIPHFEKMLYDNGPLLRLYAEAWCLTGKPLFRDVAQATAGWVMREMQSPEGGYYSSLDADSEHEEGKFYVWDREELHSLLDEAEYPAVEAHYGLDLPPNFEGRQWHLNVARPKEGNGEALMSARRKLLAARDLRVRPGRDDKVLTSWNALAIQGMARAGRVFAREDFVNSALRAFTFIRQALWRDGRLLATCKDGRAHLNAYLDDHAFLLLAALELLQARFDREVLDFAVELADAMLERFADPGGGFYFTGSDHEALIARMKPLSDNATPSGNGVAALALNRLSFVVGDLRYAEAARRTVEAAFAAMAEMPAAHATLLMALEEMLEPPSTVVLRGDPAMLEDWQARLASSYRPHTLMLRVAGTHPQTRPLPEPLDKPMPEHANAWVCSGTTCLAPIHDFDKLAAVLANSALKPSR